MLMAAGLGWAVTGALLSYTARHRIRAVTMLAPQMLIAFGLALLILPDYRALATVQVRSLSTLAALLVGAGVVNACGILTLQRAMSAGHNGGVWAVGQSALIVPFLAGTLFFGDPLSPLRLLGVAGIVCSLAAFGLARDKSSGERPLPDGGTPLRAFLLALAALLILGSAQTLISLPSHLAGITDGARLRVPLLYLGHVVVYVGLWLRQPETPNRRSLSFSALCGITAMASSLLLFQGLDRLAPVHMASLGFPVAIGSCILIFSAYSALVLREPFTRIHAFGMVAGLLGICGLGFNGG